MSSTAAPFGFRLVNNVIGQSHAREFPIATGYAVNIFKGDPVALSSTLGSETPTVEVATADGARASTAGTVLLGIFAGCRYTDSTGKRVESNYWPASTASSDAVALVYNKEGDEFECQADGSLARTMVGSQVTIVGLNTAGGGSTVTGLSSAGISATPVIATANGAFVITGISSAIDNAAGDAYTKAIVRIANPQLGQGARAVQNDLGTN